MLSNRMHLCPLCKTSVEIRRRCGYNRANRLHAQLSQRNQASRMSYRICKTFEIESGHMLSKHPDLCKFPHGHNRKVEFVLEADELDRNEMVCDFKSFQEAMGSFLKAWDHALCVNTKDPHHDMLKKAYGERIISFENLDPTTEIMARQIHDELKQNLAAYASHPSEKYPLRPSVRIVKVRVWETSSSWAEYSETPSV